MTGQRERETLKEGGASLKCLSRRPFGWRVPWESGKDNSLWLTWATASGENSWWMEGGQMAKGLCPGVGPSCGKESVEKRGRERERPVFLGLRGKPIKPYTQDLYRSRRHRASSRGGLESLGRKVSSAGFHALKSWPWRTRRNLNLLGFGTKKCRVRELEKARFGKRKRPALHRNRSPLTRQEGAAVRIVSCCTNPRKE